MRETEREITKEWRELSFDVIKDINDKKDETTVEYKKAKEKVQRPTAISSVDSHNSRAGTAKDGV